MGEGTYILHISTNAFADTAEIALLYEQKVASLGDHFLDDLENNFKSITTHPTYFSRYKKGSPIRKKLLKIFPYKIFYLIEKTEVKVLAIIHLSRSQNFITRKLK